MASETLPLYMAFMTQTGTDKLSEVKLRESIEMHTGGIGATTLISQITDPNKNDTVVLDGTKWISKLFVKGKSLAEKTDKLFDLILTILTRSKLDNQQKAIELLSSSCASQESSIASSGNSYALQRLQGRYTVAGAMSEKFSGVTSYEDCKTLLKQVKDDWSSVLKDLQTIRAKLMDMNAIKNGLIINLTGDEDTLRTIQPELKKFIEKLTGDESGESETDPQVASEKAVLAKIVDVVDKVATPQQGDDTSQAQHPWI